VAPSVIGRSQRQGHLERGERRSGVATGQVHQVGGGVGGRGPLGSSARPTRTARSSSPSGSTRNTIDRLMSGALTSKKGFSVVAPMSVRTPSSTAGSRASCCD
jgi:hypothetical protein